MARGYFHRGESEQYAFYRTPKILFTDPEYETLTALAKVLYGVLLDRESLSDKNKWVDDRGRIFVYMTNKTICRLLRISDKTATKILVELEKIDLIQRVRQGQGKPSRIISAFPGKRLVKSYSSTNQKFEGIKSSGSPLIIHQRTLPKENISPFSVTSSTRVETVALLTKKLT